MLVLTRKLQEQIKIGNDIVVTILQVRGQAVRVGIEAPRTIRVLRAELSEGPAPRPHADESKTELHADQAAKVTMRVTAAQPLASQLQARRAPSARVTSSMNTRARLGAAMMATYGAVG
jgi:carbon storage regulator CsrA